MTKITARLRPHERLKDPAAFRQAFHRRCWESDGVLAVYGLGASLYGARSGRRQWVDSGRRSVYALALVTTIAWVILEAAFWRSDFTFNVVAQHSSTTTPAFYKLAAAWSSQEGSLLLWVFLLSVWSSLILFLTRRRVPQRFHLALTEPESAARLVCVAFQSVGNM